MVAKCCWKESKAELPPEVIIETAKKPPPGSSNVDSSKKASNVDTSKERCRISLDSSFSNDSVGSSAVHRLSSQSFEIDLDRKLDDPDNELIDLTKSGRSGGKLNSRARSTSSSGSIGTVSFA